MGIGSCSLKRKSEQNPFDSWHFPRKEIFMPTRGEVLLIGVLAVLLVGALWLQSIFPSVQPAGVTGETMVPGEVLAGLSPQNAASGWTYWEVNGVRYCVDDAGINNLILTSALAGEEITLIHTTENARLDDCAQQSDASVVQVIGASVGQ